MPRRSLVAIAIAVAGLAALPAVSVADGPYEPNETAAMALTPVTAPRIDAGLETPQDEDWYLLHPQGVRQIGVLATLATPCPQSYGTLVVELLDAEGSTYPLAVLRLGSDISSTTAPRTSASATFTSQVGHRYFVHVEQSRCDGVGYSLELAPNGALGTALAPTRECATAATARDRASYKLKRLKAARSRARGARRKALSVKVQLQSQQVTVARATAKTTCTRRALTGRPWE
jgi:hypothetical protein